MIITHKMAWDKCLSHQIWPAIEKGWKDEGHDVHFFWGLAAKNTSEIKACMDRGDEWWFVDTGYLSNQIIQLRHLIFVLQTLHLISTAENWVENLIIAVKFPEMEM